MAVLIACPTLADDGAGIEKLELWLGSIDTMQAQFVQRTLSERGEVISESLGTMSLSRPGLFRWHYTSPAELLVVSDGRQVYNYDVELESVTVISQEQAVSGSPIALLTGQKRLTDSFSASGHWASDDVSWTELVPRGEQGDFRLVRLGIRDKALQAMELHDQLGQVTRVEFSSLVQNEPVAAELFVFEIPPDVDVIEGGEATP